MGVFPWLVATAFAFVLASAPGLDDIPDMSAERAQAKALEDEQRADDARRRFERLLQAQCQAERGPQAMTVFAADGTASCVSRRDVRVIGMASR